MGPTNIKNKTTNQTTTTTNQKKTKTPRKTILIDTALVTRLCQAWKSLSGHLEGCGQPTSVTLLLRFQIPYEKELKAEGQAKSELKVREWCAQLLTVRQSIIEERQANKNTSCSPQRCTGIQKIPKF